MNNYIKEIEDNGYCLVKEYFKKDEVFRMLEKCKKIFELTKDNICQDTPFLNTNQPNVYNLQNKDIFFIEKLLSIEIIEEILVYFLNDKWYRQIPKDLPNYILRSYGARSSNTALPLHIDSFIPYIGNEVISMQVIIVLEDMRFENGCSVVIPGSHQFGRYADNSKDADKKYINAQAGDIVLWDSRLWHGTSENLTKGTRWAIVATFTRWWIKQHFNITNSIPKDIFDLLSPKFKSILGFGSLPNDDEYAGIEIKKGYEEL